MDNKLSFYTEITIPEIIHLGENIANKSERFSFYDPD